MAARRGPRAAARAGDPGKWQGGGRSPGAFAGARPRPHADFSRPASELCGRIADACGALSQQPQAVRTGSCGVGRPGLGSRVSVEDTGRSEDLVSSRRHRAHGESSR